MDVHQETARWTPARDVHDTDEHIKGASVHLPLHVHEISTILREASHDSVRKM